MSCPLVSSCPRPLVMLAPAQQGSPAVLDSNSWVRFTTPPRALRVLAVPDAPPSSVPPLRQARDTVLPTKVLGRASRGLTRRCAMLVLSYLASDDLYNASLVGRHWSALALGPELWER